MYPPSNHLPSPRTDEPALQLGWLSGDTPKVDVVAYRLRLVELSYEIASA